MGVWQQAAGRHGAEKVAENLHFDLQVLGWEGRKETEILVIARVFETSKLTSGDTLLTKPHFPNSSNWGPSSQTYKPMVAILIHTTPNFID